MLLETPRLFLREFAEEDAAATNVYERDPEVCATSRSVRAPSPRASTTS